MVHRNLTPSTVLVKHDNSPILTGFEHAPDPGGCVCGFPSRREGLGRCGISRGSRSGAAVQQTFGPTSIRFARLSRSCSRAEERRRRRQGRGSLRLGYVDDDPAGRSSLSELDAFLSDLLGEPVPGPPPPPARVLDGRANRILQGPELPHCLTPWFRSGVWGTTFKVVEVDSETDSDLGTYVAKVARDEEVGQRVVLGA